MQSTEILIVDDEKDIRELVAEILQDEGYGTRLAASSDEALKALDQRVPGAVILDIWLQGSELDGLGVLEIIKQQYPFVPVIMISGHGTVETAVQAIRIGAYDYVEKPFKADKLLLLLKRAIEAERLRQENQELRQRGTPETELLGNSSTILHLRHSIEKVAQTSSRILISGSSGCGKEVVARQIHQQSKRSEGPFIILNAANISPENMESELLGIQGGIASEGRVIGVLERAHKGTLFIDEIADMPAAVQARFLRILQEQSFMRVGGQTPVNIDVRVIAATAKNLNHEIEAGRFREDLYYRLNVVPLRVPALTERREDIAILARYFIQRCASLLGVAPRPLSDDTIAVFESCEWPGNVRQLRNVIEWLLIMAPGEQNSPIRAAMLPPDLVAGNAALSRPETNNDMMGLPLRGARELFEKQYLLAQISRFSGNISKTAQFVGMERSALHRKLKLLGIHSEEE
jgi:two-component system nitrogen regulation response regulator NtrX